MSMSTLGKTLSPTSSVVKSQSPLPGFERSPVSVIHHKVWSPYNKIILYRREGGGKVYGVSSSRRPLSIGLFNKRLGEVERFLNEVVQLPQCQVEGVVRLLRLAVVYGQCFPTAAKVANNFQETPPKQFIPYAGYAPPKRRFYGCSRATFWRAIRQLRELGLITVINRFLIRPHAQISNLYRLDKLLLAIARYLAEHGRAILDPVFKRFWQMPGSAFWRWVFSPKPPQPAPA